MKDKINDDSHDEIFARTINVDLQVALDESVSLQSQIPSLAQFKSWVNAVMSYMNHHEPIDVSIRIVDKTEMLELNKTYRNKSGLTNVLSFPYESPQGIHLELLGDVVLCVPVIIQESTVQMKKSTDHWAHMLVHSVLHLLGYDHQSDKDAEQMESMEIKILASMNISNPYGETEKK